ncbi:uncharacterized protein LOC108914771 isoform X2 [Anoplophora glabripennis]|uniref:uncharacterized protein LOC108914771 isoform X2 n=1 Tax=Anoplophora glabripennis TaxID=217634 RepID=UPI00087544B1|nr:uncharacterized protein LOC108914771 isoform X2 [Anoplophora glabripennis]
MSYRPNSGSKFPSGHRRSESVGHQRNSSNSGHNRSDSGHSLNFDREERKQGHHQSKFVHEKDSNVAGVSNRLEFHSNIQSSERRCTRPTSLYPLKTNDSGIIGHDVLQPEREPIHFDIMLVGAPPEVEQLVDNIKRVAEHFLYHWKTFPIILPNPVSHCDSFSSSQISSDGSLGRMKTKFHLRDLFIAPSFDELDAVAVDGKGEPRKLTGKQLEYIRERGEFEVESLNFPGQQHRWKLSQLLQKGTENSHDSLLNDLALALRFIVVTAKGRLISHFFSISQAVKALLLGFLRILDVLIGIPSLQTHNLEAKIREERNKYLVAELVCRPENEDSLELLCSYIRKQLRRAAMEKFEVARECSQPPVALPYRFLTPSGSELDLRLWDRGLMRKALPVLISILERETRGWFLHFRERLIAELRAQKMPDDDIQKVSG